MCATAPGVTSQPCDTLVYAMATGGDAGGSPGGTVGGGDVGGGGEGEGGGGEGGGGVGVSMKSSGQSPLVCTPGKLLGMW